MNRFSDQLKDDKKKQVILVCLLLSLGFVALSVFNYYVSKTTIREALVERELPLTSDNIYSEIQKDLIRPVFISSMMAHDTFLRDWILSGEQELPRITRYLHEIKSKYGAFTSFLVSDKTLNYYNTTGILKKVSPSEPRDVWYYRVRAMQPPYEINVDPDLSNRDEMTIFINYRVFDYHQNLIGATGVGLTVDSVRKLIDSYHRRYQRTIYFVNRQGTIVLQPKDTPTYNQNIKQMEGLKELADKILHQEGDASYQYRRQGREHLLNVRFIPELQWFLFVEKPEDEALVVPRKTLLLNIGVCFVVTLFMLFLVNITINYYRRRLETMATTDALTGLHNRQSFELLIQQVINDHRRNRQPFAAILADVDLFKQVNDRHGHLIGDRMIRELTETLRVSLRESDIVCRWGGEEFLMILKNCTGDDAVVIAEHLRQSIADRFAQRPELDLPITVSLGVAAFHDGDSIDDLLAAADQALYRAKNSGRNRVCTAE